MPRGESASGKRLILIALNEVNITLAEKYISPLKLKNFARLLERGVKRTRSENKYQQIEPWIQWVSAQSGLTADEHGIYRLGDIVDTKVPQIYEKLEDKGLVVGAVSPMNTENRLRRPAYFVPDPWTKTPSDGGFWSRLVTMAVAQVVNDNAEGRIRLKHLLALSLGLLRFARPRNYGAYLTLALRSIGAPWRKALFLDLFLNDLHYRLFTSRHPDFSTVFFNAGAHIQHHYFFNIKMAVESAQKNPAWYVSDKVDPFAEMLQVYDRILGDYLDLPDADLIVATGLTQKAYGKVTFYWRLKKHAAFLKRIGISFREVLPRMTRDFLIECDTPEQAVLAERVLEQVVAESDGQRIFGLIDNRGASLFVTLTYPDDVQKGFIVNHSGGQFDLKPHVAFVAIKNGMHDPNGFVFYKGDIARHAPPDHAHVKELFGTVMNYFGPLARVAAVTKVIFINRFFSPDDSATSQLLSDLAFSLASEGRTVHVITGRGLSDNAQAALPANEVVKGVHVHRVWMTSVGQKRLMGKLLDYLTFYLIATWKLFRLAQAGDLIIVKTDPPMIGWAAAVAARWRRARLVNWLQDLFPEVAEQLKVPWLSAPLARILRTLRNRALYSARMNVVIGQGMRAQLIRLGCDPSRVCVIPNWSDGKFIEPVPNKSNPLRKEWGLEGKFVVGYSGNFGRVHEFATLLEAGERLRDRADICFLMIGRGVQYEMLRQETALRKLSNWEFRPFLPRARLAHGLAAADIHLVSLQAEQEGLVVPSKFYGIIAAGRPCVFIGAKDGEITKLIRENGCGAVIEQGDGAALAQQILTFASNKAELDAMGVHARELFVREFNQPIALSRWQEVIASLAGPAISPERTAAPADAGDEVSLAAPLAGFHGGNSAVITSAISKRTTTVLQHAKAYGTVDGGIEHVVRELVTGLNAQPDYRCDVLCQGNVSQQSNGGKYEVLRNATTFTLSSAGLSWDDFAAWHARRQRYDIIHVHLPWPQSHFNALLAPVKGAVVVHWHSDIVRKRALYTAFKPFETWLLRRADKICVTSEKLMQESAVLGPYHAKCEVIPIGIGDLAPEVTDAHAAAVQAVTQGRKLIFALGRLVLYKGFGYLIEAAKNLSDDYVVVIGGRGPLNDVLQSEINRYNLGNRVKLAGYITDGEAQAYMEACECFCLPSAHNAEAFGIVQLEAMRAGKPVISTRLRGSGVEWVNQHMVTGLVVPPADPHALAEAIMQLGADRAVREQFGKNGRARYEALFTAERMVAATEKMYRSLL